jgi:hypothetical protein
MYENGLMTDPSFSSTSSTLSTTPNNIIRRAYATTKSFGKVISIIVLAQAGVRRWLAVRELQILRLEKLARGEKQAREDAAVKITACVRGFLCRRTYNRTIKGKSTEDNMLMHDIRTSTHFLFSRHYRLPVCIKETL